MLVTSSYTLDAGTFTIKDRRIIFRDPYVRIPLVQNVKIGRSEDLPEQSFCDGTHIGEVGFEYGNGQRFDGFLSFVGRPSYNGQKLILPYDELVKISRHQGDIIFNPSAKTVYRHATENSHTVLWTPQDGIVGVASKPGDVLERLVGEGKELPIESYLLFGGYDGRSLDERFSTYSYYARIEFDENRTMLQKPRIVFDLN